MSDAKNKEQLDLLLSENHPLRISEAEEAVKLAEELEDPDHRSWYLSRFARKMASAQWWDNALKVARLTTGFYDEADALLTIAEEMIRAGEVQRGLLLLQEVIKTTNETQGEEVWPWQKADALNRAASLFRQIGNIDTALKIWNEAFQVAQAGQSHDTDCLSVLAEITKALALAGQLEFAKRVAESIQSVGKREYALRQIQAD